MLTVLSDRAAEALKGITIPFEHKARELLQDRLMIAMQIQGWYKTHGIKAGRARDKKTKLTEILGRSPNFNLRLEYMTAVWGLEWRGHKFLIFSSERGTSIEVLDTFPQDQMESFLKDVRKTLLNTAYRDDLWFKGEDLADL